MDIYEILNLKSNATRDKVKQSYYKLLFQLHPHNKSTGNSQKYMILQEAYKKYVSGDSFINCFSIVPSDIGELKCRCDGLYTFPIDFVGRIECDFCSCFIEVETPIKDIESS